MLSLNRTSHTLQTQRTTGAGMWNDINYGRRRDGDQDERNDYIMEERGRERERERERPGEGGKINGLVSYGKYGRVSSYPGQRNKR